MLWIVKWNTLFHYYQNKRLESNKVFVKERKKEPEGPPSYWPPKSHYHQSVETPMGNFFSLKKKKIKGLNMIWIWVILLDNFCFGYIGRESTWCTI